MDSQELVWRIRARSAPRVFRACPRCDLKREFVSTEKFRVNGHQSRLDVWLIFQCVVCKFTWKLTIYTRVLPSDLEGDLLERFTQNDRALAAQYASDEAMFRKNGAAIEVPTEYDVEGPDVDWSRPEARVRLEIAGPVAARVEAILAKRLKLSRNQVDRLIDSGAIRADGRKLPKKLNDPLAVRLDLDAIRRLKDG